MSRGESDGVLVRDFIHASLYHPTEGYFVSNAAAVGALAKPISFRQLAGRREWEALQRSLYASADTAWFTPSELFQPWYGYAVLDFILSSHSSATPLKIYEVGGGGGTLARNILDRLQETAPAVYRRCRYTSVEISPALAKRQRERITTKHMHVPATATAATATGTQAPAALSAVRRAPWVANGARRSFGSDDASHEAVHSVAVFDAADAKGWGTPSNEPCFILLFEVLDNLPHDRVQWCREENEWQETRVRHLEGWEKSCNKVLEEEKSRPCEVLRRVSDPLIQRCLTTVLNQSPSSGVSPPLSSSSGSSSSSSGGGGSMLSRLSSSLQGMLASLMGGERVTWLPTGCMRLLETVYTARPNATVIAADFSFLPDVRIAGANAPLVAAKLM
ncbi:hypothetical protein CLOM_g4130 [Closterium sp. NIES-68]|nr:hypothetical protein CLOM_g4130 [Closterium sp. NIES-68]GJP62913.1 hypothetical protein CLOP_g19977 [Closterium sp. NIES-67]